METKAWYESKINWTAMFGMVAPFLVMWGFNVPSDFWTDLAAFAVAGQNLLVLVMRTWFTKKLVTASAK